MAISSGSVAVESAVPAAHMQPLQIPACSANAAGPLSRWAGALGPLSMDSRGSEKTMAFSSGSMAVEPAEPAAPAQPLQTPAGSANAAGPLSRWVGALGPWSKDSHGSDYMPPPMPTGSHQNLGGLLSDSDTAGVRPSTADRAATYTAPPNR